MIIFIIFISMMDKHISITLTIISFIGHNDHQYQILGFLRPKAISV